MKQSWCDYLAGMINVYELANGQKENKNLNKIGEEE